MTECNPIPGKDPALATRFATFDAAMRVADRIAADDSEWSYNVERKPDGQFVIVVHSYDDDTAIWLGYL